MSTETAQTASPSLQPLLTPPQPRIPMWRGVLAIVVIAVIMLLLYFAGYMSARDLNRISIIADAVIGLLFAPAVLDPTGFFGRAMPWMQRYAQRIHSWTNTYLPGVSGLFDQLAGTQGTRFPAVFVSVTLSVIIVSGLKYLGPSFLYIILLGAYLISWLLAIIEVIKNRLTGNSTNIFGILITTIVFPILAPVLVILTPILFVIQFFLQFTGRTASSLYYTLSAQEKLRTALIVWGICIFLVGRLFEFFSTYS